MPKTARLSQPPVPAEWDFRAIPEFAVPVATEYEYARSSPFAQGIESWLTSAFQCVPAHYWVRRLPQLKAAGLIRYAKQSCFHNLVVFDESSDSHDVERRLELEAQVVSRWDRLKKENVRIGEVIRRLVETIDCPNARFGTLSDLGRALPLQLQDQSLSRIAVTFERFPEPFVDTLSALGEEYIRSRIRPPIHSTPVFEIEGRRIDYLQALGDVPGLGYHEFLIDWSFSLSEISRAFQTWVNQRLASRQGNKAKQARLKWLAAHRLQRSGVRFAEISELIQNQRKKRPQSSKLDVLPGYTQESEWSEAIRKAEEMLKGNFILVIRSDYAYASGSQVAQYPR